MRASRSGETVLSSITIRNPKSLNSTFLESPLPVSLSKPKYLRAAMVCIPPLLFSLYPQCLTATDTGAAARFSSLWNSLARSIAVLRLMNGKAGLRSLLFFSCSGAWATLAVMVILLLPIIMSGKTEKSITIFVTLCLDKYGDKRYTVSSMSCPTPASQGQARETGVLDHVRRAAELANLSESEPVTQVLSLAG